MDMAMPDLTPLGFGDLASFLPPQFRKHIGLKRPNPDPTSSVREVDLGIFSKEGLCPHHFLPRVDEWYAINAPLAPVYTEEERAQCLAHRRRVEEMHTAMNEHDVLLPGTGHPQPALAAARQY